MSQPLTCLIMLSPKITAVFFLFMCVLVRINIGTDGLRQLTHSFFFFFPSPRRLTAIISFFFFFFEIWLSLVVFVSHKICWLWFFLYFFSYISPGKSCFSSFCRQLLLPLTIFELFDSYHLFSIVFYMKSKTKSICFYLILSLKKRIYLSRLLIWSFDEVPTVEMKLCVFSG